MGGVDIVMASVAILSSSMKPEHVSVDGDMVRYKDEFGIVK